MARSANHNLLKSLGVTVTRDSGVNVDWSTIDQAVSSLDATTRLLVIAPTGDDTSDESIVTAFAPAKVSIVRSDDVTYAITKSHLAGDDTVSVSTFTVKGGGKVLLVGKTSV